MSTDHESNDTVAKKRGYKIQNVAGARKVASESLDKTSLEGIKFGLPEIDDRYHIWRVPLLDSKNEDTSLGLIIIDAYTGDVDKDKSTDLQVIKKRRKRKAELKGRQYKVEIPKPEQGNRKKTKNEYELSSLKNTLAYGRSQDILPTLPPESVDLIFTSPPYYNARKEYSEYTDYQDYLSKIREVVQNCYRVLFEGCFFVMNVSPVLIPRRKRSESSRRVPVHFDMHRIFVEEGFQFMDDIIWKKPEGAGWATGRGRRFSADRNPMQYKPVPVTEHLLVYRKCTDRLIDWNIKAHPNSDVVEDSKIEDGYEVTDVWELEPSNDKRHDAVFPVELAERVIKYYSFRESVVLDPFAGIGTTGKAAHRNERRFVLVEKEKEYLEAIREDLKDWLGRSVEEVDTIGCEPIQSNKLI